jgi:hypothetical protein
MLDQKHQIAGDVRLAKQAQANFDTATTQSQAEAMKNEYIDHFKNGAISQVQFETVIELYHAALIQLNLERRRQAQEQRRAKKIEDLAQMRFGMNTYESYEHCTTPDEMNTLYDNHIKLNQEGNISDTQLHASRLLHRYHAGKLLAKCDNITKATDDICNQQT